MARLQQLLRTGVEKKNIGHLPLPAKIYVSGLFAAFAAITGYCIGIRQPFHGGQFIFYLICGILVSNMKVWLPGITGTLSVNYVFILVSVTDLGLADTVAIGCISAVTQLFWAARKVPRPVQIIFTMSSIAIASGLAYEMYHANWLLESAPFRLFWASVMYFLCNTVSFGFIIALTEGKNFYRLWLDNLFWTAPHYLVGGGLAGLLHIFNQFAGWQSAILVFPTVYLVYHSYRLYLTRLEEEKRHVGEVADLHLRTIQALALAIDARDGTTFGHLRRVQVYARELARELGLSEPERKALDAAALLHDIGKLAVPEHIISKPGKLTPEEFEKMKVHPVVGAEILDSVRFPYPVVPIVRAHHEKWDGSGYPQGLQGEEIPIGARILAAIDCLDALASDRQYRRALPLEQAMLAVIAESGKSFDPRVVEVLSRRYVELEALARKHTPEISRLSTGLRIGNGSGPAAGLEPSAACPAQTDPGFIASIAAARQEFQTLLELTSELGNSLRVDETLALLSSRLKPVIPYNGIAIYTIHGDRLATQYAAGEDAALFRSLAIPLGEGISGWVTQNNKPIINGNPSVEPGYLKDPSRFSVHRSALSVPLPGIAGVIGALTLYHRDAAAFTKDHLRVLLAIGSKAGLTIENALRFGEAEETAVTDALTGLANTRSMFVRLDTALKSASQDGSRLAVLVADMDGFKQINDQFGHTTGNQVLQETGRAMRDACEEGDYIARMGGDEFLLLLSNATPAAVEDRVRELNRVVAEIGYRLRSSEPLRLSIGASYFPDDGTDAEELLAVADSRMYEMKRQHHNEVVPSCGLTRLAHALERSATLGPPPVAARPSRPRSVA